MKNHDGEYKLKLTQLEIKKEYYQISHQKHTFCLMHNLKRYYMPHTLFKSGRLIKVGFAYDGSTLIVYNYENEHILLEEDMSTDKIDLIISNVVAAIGGKYLIPKGIGTVICYWTDNEGKTQTRKLNNVIYFTD